MRGLDDDDEVGSLSTCKSGDCPLAPSAKSSEAGGVAAARSGEGARRRRPSGSNCSLTRMASDSDTDDETEPESYFYGLASAEEVAALDMLPAPAERVANTLYRKMQKIGDEEVEVVVRTHNTKRHGVHYNRACTRCGNLTNEPMATPGHVFCARNACGGKKKESANRIRNEHYKARRDAQEPALQALMEAKGVERAPENVEHAKDNVVYAKLNPKKGQQPYLCMRHGKSYEAACPCGKVKSKCVKCHQMYARKGVCFNCSETMLSRKAQRDGKQLCATCEAERLAEGGTVPGKTVTTEQRFFNAFLPLITYPDGSPWPPDQRDQRKDGGLGTPKNKKRGRECSTDSVSFPDCLHREFKMDARPKLAVVTECDEHSHSDTKYTPSCIGKKIDTEFQCVQALAAREFVPKHAKGHVNNDMIPVVFLLVNPDECDVTPRVSFADRMRAAAAVAKHFLWMDEARVAEMDTQRPIVITMYYHSVKGRRFLEYFGDNEDKIHWVGNLNFQPGTWPAVYDAPALSPATAPAPSRPASPESPCARLVGTHNAEASCSTDPM